MRAIVSSVVSAALLIGCGPKPETPHITPETTSQPLFLTFKQKTNLSIPRSPLGQKLKIVVGSNANYYVLDTDHHRILRFSATGELLRQAGGLGTGPLQFDNPVDFDSDGLALWILDRQNQRLVRLDLALNYVEELSLAPAPGDPTSTLWYDGVAAAVSGEIVLLDRAEPKAVRISPAGDLITSYGGFGLGAGRMTAPTALATALDGGLYVADGAHILHYGRTGNFKAAQTIPQPIIAISAGDKSAWVVSRAGKLYNVAQDRLHPAAIDPAAILEGPISIDIDRDGDVVILDRELSVWLLEPPPR